MKLIDKWKSGNKPTISFEFFPPRTDKAAENLNKAIDKLSNLEPDFVSVTFGAGGSTREGSYQLIDKLKNEKGHEVLAYFAAYGLAPETINSVLDSYKNIGVHNILAVRGDKPADQENFSPHPESFKYASDMLKFIRPQYDFCIGVAGYPEGHIEARSKGTDIDYLKQKVDLGAEYIIANYFYDNQYFFDFKDSCLSAGINIPVISGVMPVYSTKMMYMLAEMCGATIVNKLQQGIDKLPENDKEVLLEFGVEYAKNQCSGLIKAGVPGLHFYTMDRSKSTYGIISGLREEGMLKNIKF